MPITPSPHPAGKQPITSCKAQIFLPTGFGQQPQQASGSPFGAGFGQVATPGQSGGFAGFGQAASPGAGSSGSTPFGQVHTPISTVSGYSAGFETDVHQHVTVSSSGPWIYSKNPHPPLTAVPSHMLMLVLIHTAPPSLFGSEFRLQSLTLAGPLIVNQ